MLTDAGLVEQREARFELTPKGMRRLVRTRLAELFKKLDRDRMGVHELERTGFGHERNYHTKPTSSATRSTSTSSGPSGTRSERERSPIHLSPDDFEIEETEHVVRSSTVLMLDLSLSMPMRDNFLPAKKVAMALHSLISMQYPRDYLGIVGFSEVARILTVPLSCPR